MGKSLLGIGRQQARAFRGRGTWRPLLTSLIVGDTCVRKLVFVLALFGFALPAFASKSLTVAQLEQRLAADRGKSDVEVAQQLSGFELTERLSATTLARLESTSPGAKTSQELKILADRSAFLPLPTAEIPSIATPDLDSQRKLIALLVNYLTSTLPRLPNFYATRQTTHFEETPLVQTGTYSFPYEPLHETNAFDVTVLYQKGREVVDAGSTKANASTPQANGLHDWGVFGPILSTVFLDAAKSSLSWSHWEQSPAGPLAVFRYEVPQQKSHYRVSYCCVPAQDRLSDPTSFDHIVGYHGEISIDPKEGSILRLTVQADLTPSDPILMADIMVEYGPVEIGGRTYICATRSISLSRALSTAKVRRDFVQFGPTHAGPPQYLLNDVSFVHYHMFRADSHILTSDEASQQSQQPAPASPNQTPPETALAIPPPPSSIPPADQQPSPVASPTASQAAPPQPHLPEDIPVIKTTARQVMEEVVVTTKSGEPVSGLTQPDFEISEDNQPQKINSFHESTPSNTQATAQPHPMPPLLPGMHTNVPPAPPTDAVNVLLIDSLNTEAADQTDVRRQVLNFLTKTPPGTPMAIFVLGSKLRCLQSFTSDNSTLLAALHDPHNGLNVQKNSFLDSRSDRASNDAAISMLQTMQASPYGIAALQSALQDLGAQTLSVRASMTFQALMYLGHYLAGIPGRKNLIWFSGSYPLAIFPSKEQMARIKENPNLPQSLDREKQTSDLFTASQIAVYPISAEGMTVEHINEASSAGPGDPSGPGHIGSSDAVMTPYSAAAGDRVATVSAMEQLADSTGGKAFYNTNDLGGALTKAIADGSDYYSIGYSPTNMNPQPTFRQIDIKLARGKYKLAYRHGYDAGEFSGNSTSPGTKPSVDPLTPLLQFGLPPATGILYGVRAERSNAQPTSAEPFDGQNPNLKGPLTRYTVDFVIRSQDLAFSASPDGERTARFLLGLKAFGRDGSALNWEANEESLSIKADQLESLRTSGIPEHLTIDLPSTGDIHLLTAVYDLDGGSAGTLEIPLQATSAAGANTAQPSEPRHP